MLNRRKLIAAISALPIIAKRASARQLSESGEIVKSFDARDWARHFVDHVKANPAIATDEATMIAWFASALMRGYDEHARRFPEDAERTTTEETLREDHEEANRNHGTHR